MNDIEYIVYTNKSLGSLNIKDACRYMNDHKVKKIELLDFDRIEHLNQVAINQCNTYDLDIEVGIEISTNICGLSIIALGINNKFYDKIEQFIDNKEINNKVVYNNILDVLKEKYSIDLDKREILLYSDKPFINLLDIARLMYRKGYVTCVREAITHYISNSIELNLNNNDVNEIVNLLKNNCRKICYYNYGNNVEVNKLVENMSIQRLDIRTFENHTLM